MGVPAPALSCTIVAVGGGPTIRSAACMRTLETTPFPFEDQLPR